MQTLANILTGTGTLEATKQGALALLAPAAQPADTAGLTFSELFMTLLPSEPTTQAEIGNLATKVTAQDSAPQDDPSETQDPPPNVVDLRTSDQADTQDSVNPKAELAPHNQPDEVAEKMLPTAQPNVEEWAAVHQVKLPPASAMPDPKSQLSFSEPNRPGLTASADQLRPRSNSDKRTGLPVLPITQHHIRQSKQPTHAVTAPIRPHENSPAVVQPQSAINENTPPPGNSARVLETKAPISLERAVTPQPVVADARATSMEKTPTNVPDTGRAKPRGLVQNTLLTTQDGRPQAVAPETAKIIVRGDITQGPSGNGETLPTASANSSPPMRQVQLEAHFRNLVKPASAAPPNTQASVAQSPSTVQIPGTMFTPAATPPQNNGVTMPTSDHREANPAPLPAVERITATQRKPPPREYLLQFAQMPHVPKTAAQPREIGPRQATIAQQQIQVAAQPTTQINVTSAAPIMPKLQADQRSAARNTSSVSTDFALPLRTDLTTAPSVVVSTIARPELASHVAQQIADAVQSLPNRPVEITLNPEELGRLKLQLITSEAGIAVHVSAERPETMDLLRRHIGILDQEFLKLGFEDVAFSFAGRHESQDQTDPSNDQSPDHQIEAGDQSLSVATAPSRAKLHREGGLDLRV